MTGFALDLDPSAFMVGLAIRLAMAGLFVHSALFALRDRSVHAAIVSQYRLLPEGLVPMVALMLPLASLAAAIGLLAPATVRAGSLLGLLLMGIFTTAIAINLARGRDQIDCGCGGADGQRISHGLVARNLVLCALLALAALAPTEGTIDWAIALGALGAAGSCVVFYFAANQLLANQAAFRTRGN